MLDFFYQQHEIMGVEFGVEVSGYTGYIPARNL